MSQQVELACEHAHLADDLAGREVADEPHLAGEAEGARHRAADLGGDAERLAGVSGMKTDSIRRSSLNWSRNFSVPSFDRSRARMSGAETAKLAPSWFRSAFDRSVIRAKSVTPRLKTHR